MPQAYQKTAEKLAGNLSRLQTQSRAISLSKYFPSGSVYFYGFPAGLESNFYNAVPPWIEELVAARPLVCAGDNIKILTFTAAYTNEIQNLLQQECGSAVCRQDQIMKLPAEISSEVAGHERNRLVKQYLAQQFGNEELVMAQPFLDRNLKSAFQIDPELTVWLNDKKNLPCLIPAQYRPRRLAEFANGAEFAAAENIKMPCVVKISSSSAGDGVRICRGEHSLDKAQQQLKTITNPILIEEYIEAKENYCIQFAVPHDPSDQIEIIGQNRQLISPAGEFLGAAVDLYDNNPVLKEIHRVMKTYILPLVRARGWYGIGGIDVLVGQHGDFYFIDANFRMTATFAYVCRVKNMEIKKPLISFTGSFRGSLQELKNIFAAHAARGHANQILEILSVTRQQNTYWFNAGMLFDHPESVIENAKDLLKLGINSQILANLAQRTNLV